MLVALDKIFAEDPSPYVLLDRDLTMIWANAAYLRATGLARDEVVGRRMFDVFPAEAESIPDQMLRASLRRAVEQGRPDHLPLIPYPIRNQDGRMEERFWSATNTPIKDAEGHVEFILQNTNDITALYREDRTSSQPNDQAGCSSGPKRSRVRISNSAARSTSFAARSTRRRASWPCSTGATISSAS